MGTGFLHRGEKLVNLERIRGHCIFLLKTHGGLPLAARDALKEWHAVAESSHSYLDQIQALLAAGGNWLQMKRPDKALGLFEKALGLIDEHQQSNTKHRSLALYDLALAYDQLGNAEQSIHYAEQVWAYIVSGEVADPYDSHAALLLGKSYIAGGRWEEAYKYSEQALQRFNGSQDTSGKSKALNNLGLVCIEIGEYEQADQLLQEALTIKQSIGDISGAVYTLTELGRLHHKQGDLVTAVRYSRKALQSLWENVAFMDKAEVARLCRLFGAVFAKTGDRQGAIAYLQRAITYYAQLSQWREWSEVTQSLDEVIRSRPASSSARVGIEWQDKETLRNLTTLLGLMDTLEGLYPELRGRSELVTKYALLIGESCDLDGSTRESLSHAARLSNVGVTFPDADVEVPDRSTQRRRENPELAERVLSMVSVSEECRTGIRHQRERFDGSGFPDGLAGSNIPIISRILAIADSYVARATDDDTGIASHHDAMEYLYACAGTKFDGELVRRFAEIHRVPSQCDRFGQTSIIVYEGSEFC